VESYSPLTDLTVCRDEKEADQVVTLLDTVSFPESYLPVVEATRATELSQTFTISRILPDVALFVDRIVRMNHVAAWRPCFTLFDLKLISLAPFDSP